MEYLTFSLSIIGTILGIINYIYTWSRDKVRIKIKPRWQYALNIEKFSLEIINISTFDVYIFETSIYLKKNQKLMDLTNLYVFPLHLKSRENKTVIQTTKSQDSY